MQNEEETLNTEPNDIAGNRIDGPVGNTAAQHNTGLGVGQPGTAAPAGQGAAQSGTEPTSSESLAASETSVGAGAVGGDNQPQENKEANPASLTPGDTYGGNFSNSTQNSYHDQDRRENQNSDPNRGEFGAQNLGGTTHGGFGNQNRLADYEPNNTAEDKYYGGPGAPGPQDNAYRDYDGRDARSDSRSEYGFERGTDDASSANRRQSNNESSGSAPGNPGNDPARTDAKAAYQNDNGAVKGPDRGYADDYGHTTLQSVAPNATSQAAATPDQRNQTEDYLPAQSGADKQGHHVVPSDYSTNQPEMADQRGQRPADSQGYGDRGRDQANAAPDFQTGNDRNGYTQAQANNGDAAQGIGSRGGSYNDAYDDSQPNSKAGSPAKGDERSQDRSQNYGTAAREENRPDEANREDHGAPQRNAGRDGEADE
ncbi:hypothetical protein [Hymenobacter rubidus]|uniref:hypothetical protein n=1 Tax=Hymenobacter rubidus TaxID=1441626 RepID=UPI00191ED163|nr:hypothetical protein [Hymenobacter rubidus]